jgi:flagellar biosynthetic protein FliQ
MNELSVLEVGRDAIFLVLLTAGPLMAVGMVVGVAIALVQAVTSIQEMTLTFVPKLLAMFLATILLLPFMITSLIDFTRGLFERIAVGG